MTDRSVAAGSMSGDEIVALARRYTMFDWQAQAATNPIPVDRAEGVYFWTPEGRRYLDFNSQLMGVNIGHGDRRVVEAIKRQAERLPYVSPFMATEARARLGQKLAEVLPGDIAKVFFTLGGAEANDNAIRVARAVTGRQKILARYRSYHGATGGSISLTGDPRRWPNEPGLVGVVHVLDPYHGPFRPIDDAQTALAYLEETIQLEGPGTIAAFILEPVSGTNGILIPPDGYLQGVRALCDRYGILLIADEVMTGFGRTGEWFAVNLGLFGVLELIRDRATLEPMAPFNGSSDEMKAVERHLLEHGLYTFVRWWNVMTNPPLCISEKQLADGFEIIDGALDVADRWVKGA